MTHYNRIKAMSKDEMAVFLAAVECNSRGWCDDCGTMDGHIPCNGMAGAPSLSRKLKLEWLNSQAPTQETVQREYAQVDLAVAAFSKGLKHCDHDGGIGYNPQGVWCGECSCYDEPSCAMYNVTKEQDDARRALDESECRISWWRRVLAELGFKTWR